MESFVSSTSSHLPLPTTHQEKIREVIRKQALALEKTLNSKPLKTLRYSPKEAYSKCGEVCAQRGSNFYIGTFLLTPERRRAAWAIHGWGMRLDDIVDGPNSEHADAGVFLENWQRRLENIFEGEPADLFDEALAHTVKVFGLDMQPFRDLIEGMRLDLVKHRYANFDELFLYSYYVAGAPTLMLLPVLGLSPGCEASLESICDLAVSLGVATQLTNILRDVAEDASRGRLYLPQDELQAFGVSEEDIFQGRVTENWREFMKVQIRRVREYYRQADQVVSQLDKCSRWPVCASIAIYEQILDSIEANDYDNLQTRARVSNWKKLRTFILAARSITYKL